MSGVLALLEADRLQRSRRVVATVVAVAALFGLLALVLPPAVRLVCLVIGGLAAVYFSVSVTLARHADRLPRPVRRIPIWLTFVLPLVVSTLLLLTYWDAASVTISVFVLALLCVFFYYWVILPLALYQKLATGRRSRAPDAYPPVSVLVPAFNEQHYVGRTLQSVQAATYPGPVDVVVVDDGSTDGTYAEALACAGDWTTVVRKENGGKHDALNFGLDHAESDVVVTVDADCVVAEDALTELVSVLLRSPDTGAVAGNVKVSNRGSLVTNVQALEYVVGINTFRRAFDLLGIVTVVPGCLGAFRREALELVGGYDADTLTEDFDATIKLLKGGWRVHASEAVVYTEAPDTWRDLYRQRLRWFRGNFMTLAKHRDVFVDPSFGLLHRLAFPYSLLSMTFIPLAGLVVLVAMGVGLAGGLFVDLFGLMGFFVLLQVMVSLLAVEIEGEDPRLVLYSPLSVVGYKNFLDAVLLKSVLDVVRGGTLSWTSPTRVLQREEDAAVET